MGSFGIGKLNENGIELLELCERNELILTNTMFQHPIKHRTTCRLRKHQIEPRRNPVRNQIDYIIMRRSDMNKVSDSRSYNGTQTHAIID